MSNEQSTVLLDESYKIVVQLVRVFAWIGSLLVSVIYLIGAYALPLLGLAQTLTTGFKIYVEILLCVMAITTSLAMAIDELHMTGVEIGYGIHYIYVKIEKQIIGTRCLELSSLKESIPEEMGKPLEYDTSLIMAVRSGMNQNVNIAYEVGVVDKRPFVRLFISCSGENIEDIDKILHREAARTEAIILATLEHVEIKQLKGPELINAFFSFSEIPNVQYVKEQLIEKLNNGSLKRDVTFRLDQDEESKKFKADIFWRLEGAPRNTPTTNSTQIGKFLSALLQQELSASLTCVFTPANPSRKRRSLEGRWQQIRSREKIKRDTLADHSEKEKLLEEYRTIQDRSGWFNVSTYIRLNKMDYDDPSVIEDCLKGIVHSIWGDTGEFALRPIKNNVPSELRTLLRRHISPKKMHVSKLVAYVNMPRQNLPELSATFTSEFKVPARALVENEIFIGWSLYKGRKLNPVGLKQEWIREHIAILGATGSGKTTLVKQIMTEISTKTKIPWWIFDVKGSEYLDLLEIENNDIVVIRPGENPNFVIDFLDTGKKHTDRNIDTTFAILNELLKERGTSSELSPAMERLLLKALRKMVEIPGDGSVKRLEKIIEGIKTDRQTSQMTKDALLNRIEILTRNPLGSILSGGPKAIRINQFMDKRVIFDLRYVARTGGMDAARILYNLIAKRIFDAAMQRGITPGLQHVVVLEEANNLVPESYTRENAADITTGESMVMLQRATGQGVIVVSTRPNISSNILANTGTKIVFRLPYDSEVGARFLSLNEAQEKYLRSLRTGVALITTPVTETFEITTVKRPESKTATILLESTPVSTDHIQFDEPKKPPSHPTTTTADEESHSSSSSPSEEAKEEIYLDRTADTVRRIIALISSKGYLTEEQMHNALLVIDPEISTKEEKDTIRELIALGTLERETIGIVEGGFVYTLPGTGHETVTELVKDYVKEKLIAANFDAEKIHVENNEIIIDDTVILVSIESVRASTLDERIDTFRKYMRKFGNEFRHMVVILRGSVAAAKIRELIADETNFQDVTVIPAFPNSIEKMILELKKFETHKKETEEIPTPRRTSHIQDASDGTTYSSSIRVWIGLIEGYIEINDGNILWEDLIQFMETTVSQSHKRHSVPMQKEDGQRALSEMLIDEKIFAFRVTPNMRFVSLNEGLWIVSPEKLHLLKSRALDALESELVKRHGSANRSHSPLDICAGGVSYLVFPTKKILDKVTSQKNEYVCQVCHSKKLICILPAIEYIDEFEEKPEFMQITSLDNGVISVIR
ncbi:MAG: DUF87 domain-containing protein [Candidatus Thorarchaeota archaeon]|nr:DUF87 domain-containing protein [Candidatus Thorarchaeota archaeon]